MFPFFFPSFFALGLLKMQGKQVVAAVHAVIEERPLPEAELVASLWQGLMAQVDWSARPDQIEGLALREVSVRCPTPTCLSYQSASLTVDRLYIT
jgi:hypothetical protein